MKTYNITYEAHGYRRVYQIPFANKLAARRHMKAIFPKHKIISVKVARPYDNNEMFDTTPD